MLTLTARSALTPWNTQMVVHLSGDLNGAGLKSVRLALNIWNQSMITYSTAGATALAGASGGTALGA